VGSGLAALICLPQDSIAPAKPALERRESDEALTMFKKEALIMVFFPAALLALTLLLALVGSRFIRP
jgi:hypothetical protein